MVAALAANFARHRGGQRLAGMAEMTITAQALEVGVPLVFAFHLFRVVTVNMGAQHIYAFAAWALGRSSEL